MTYNAKITFFFAAKQIQKSTFYMIDYHFISSLINNSSVSQQSHFAITHFLKKRFFGF
jgi:hypothetical protein